MAETVQDRLDKANPNDLAANLQRLRDPNASEVINDADAPGPTATKGFGAIVAALTRPRIRTRATLTSQAAHVHDIACVVYSVESPAGTPLAIVSDGSPAAGQVNLEYDANTGIPTLTFAAAVTTYTIHESGPLPQNVAAVMASEP